MVLETAVALVFIFAVLVMFHELGHFLVARAVGIRVDEFAFGFGPKLIRLFKRGDTEYTIHPFPLGGFVKLAGMEPGEEDIPDGFQAQAAWKRALVIFAGPFASFLLAVIVFVLVGLYFGFPDLSKPANRVGMVNPKTEAARIDLRAGDRILSIDGVKITQGRQMTDLIHSKPGEDVRIVTEREGKRITKTGVPQWHVVYLGASWSFMQRDRAKVEGVAPESVAEKEGIKIGDELVSINGERITGGADMARQIEAAGGQETRIELMRQGKMVTITALPEAQWVKFAGAKWAFPGAYAEEVTPGSAAAEAGIKRGDRLEKLDGSKIESSEGMLRLLSDKTARGKWDSTAVIKRDDASRTVRLSLPGTEPIAQIGYHDSMGLLGFLPEPALVRAGFKESVSRGLSETWMKAGYLVKTLTSSKIKEDVGGPLMIGKVTASAVALGPYWVLSTLGGLSLSLAFINLVPLPLLDGGHIAIIAIESIRRKRITPEQMQKVQMVGLALIAMLFVVILFSDITKLIGGQVPQ